MEAAAIFLYSLHKGTSVIHRGLKGMFGMWEHRLINSFIWHKIIYGANLVCWSLKVSLWIKLVKQQYTLVWNESKNQTMISI